MPTTDKPYQVNLPKTSMVVMERRGLSAEH